MARYRDPRFPDLGPEAGTPEAPRPELTPEERVARQARRTETERTSGEALGLGTKPTGPSFGRSNAQRRSGGFGIDTLAAQMAARRRGRRRPGQPME